MNTCKTCVHWNQAIAAAYRGPAESGGFCKQEKITEEYGDSSYTNDAMVYSYHEGGSFWTGPDFGCVHHKTVSLSTT